MAHTSDLTKISERCGVVSSLTLGNVDIKESYALDFLGVRIYCMTFGGLMKFFKYQKKHSSVPFIKERCKKHFTPYELINIYKIHIGHKMEYCFHDWVDASMSVLDNMQKDAKVLINDKRTLSWNYLYLSSATKRIRRFW